MLIGPRSNHGTGPLHFDASAIGANRPYIQGMMIKLLTALIASVAFATPVLSDITIADAYARSATPNAMAGAAFMVIQNEGDSQDRLIRATSPAAKRVEIHTHRMNADGAMQMIHLEDGLVIDAGASHALARGGDHVMFMGLNDGWNQGDLIPLTLVFENAGEVVLEVVVDRER